MTWRVLLGLIWWLMWPVAEARIYKYVDATGTVSYTDELARAQPYAPQELEYLDPDPNKVKLRYTPSGRLYIANEFHGPVTVTLLLNQRQGIDSDINLKAPIVVPARAERYVGRLRYVGSGQLEISQHFVLGTPNMLNDAELQVPFRGHFRISQGFNGTFSHNQPGDRFAVDVVMPEGTPILAAKPGVVLDMKMLFVGSGMDPALKARTNFIRLLHPDGTMTVYAHLKTGSQRVGLGQTVSAGQPIAESGNTGYSTAPHLHFAVQRNDGQRLVSILFHIQGRTPQQGDWLGL